MDTTTQSLVGVTELARNTKEMINRAGDGERLVILRNNEPTAIIIDMETADRLGKIEETERDLKLVVATMVRMATDSGKRYSLDEIDAEFGYTEKDSE